ncbi:MAG: TetR/AcrR family transcriptional regulator [Hyphomonadaceae bacterium]
MSSRQTKAKAKSVSQAFGRGTLSQEIVLETSARLFNLQGFDRTSMNDIAHALGVTKPSIYYYFPSKDDILHAIIDEAAKAFEKKVAEAIADDRGALEHLRAFIRLYGEAMRDDIFRTLVLADERMLSQSGRALVITGKRRLNDIVVKLLRRAQREGEIRVADPRLASFAIFGMYNWMAYWRRDWASAPDVDAAFEQFMLSGLNASAGASQRAPASKARKQG